LEQLKQSLRLNALSALLRAAAADRTRALPQSLPGRTTTNPAGASLNAVWIARIGISGFD
jgi:hypothetical protein